jgi:hypothetical protein
MSSRPDPHSNICSVNLEIPWELAEQLIPHLTQILNGLMIVVSQRKRNEVAKAVRKEKLERELDENKGRWKSLAAVCDAEVKRRANAPGSQQAVIRQLAAEVNVTPAFLTSILKIHRQDARLDKHRSRREDILRRRISGQSAHFIAGELGISSRMVRKYLADTLTGTTPGKRKARDEPEEQS